MSDDFIPKTLTSDEVAEILKCSVKTVLDKAGSGEIPGAKVGKAWCFRLNDVNTYLEDTIQAQSEARKVRYNLEETYELKPRAYAQPNLKKSTYPDLTPYRKYLDQ
ncbi:helix-turn-helix domain-containing protein [Methylophaga sulfidovorans]|uniref:DNA binding domain-containing protein, excisionase family n=1 Tax=Methylophaga sulfidovorans TaxID=45496 RepID=A0A1I4AE40_9GAMM|nr:helix-turn-helix domain-containing protein [Methylophaga sulfidovorans]SFK54705.1 DNA binding domain-containing protein, excisionase family [Methylophaga sulfidovorans]